MGTTTSKPKGKPCPPLPEHAFYAAGKAVCPRGGRATALEMHAIWGLAWLQRNQSLRTFTPEMRRLVILAREIDRPVNVPSGINARPHHKICHDEPTRNIWND